MNPQQAAQWQNLVVGEVFKAIVTHEPLRDALVFKGARILNLHLGKDRQSLDIDSNFAAEFVNSNPDLGTQKSWLENHITVALRNYFESQNPVRFILQTVNVKQSPPKHPHVHGWNGFLVLIKVEDEKYKNIRGLPNVEIDIAAPEEFGPGAITQVVLEGLKLRGYALHRIAGEKLRAFLTSLPAYRLKMNGRMREHRAKDIHDLARILVARPKGDEEFWRLAAEEFKIACKSRYVDCAGSETFFEDWRITQQTYEADGTLIAVPFQCAENALRVVAGLLDRFDVYPLTFPLPLDRENGSYH